METFFKKQKAIITLILYVILVTVLGYFSISLILEKIGLVRDQIQKEIANRQGKYERLQELPKMKQQYASVMEKQDFLGGLLNTDDAVVLIEKLEKLATETGNDIKITVKDAAINKNSNTKNSKNSNTPATIASSLPNSNYLDMNLTLNGTYNSGINFIQKLESMDYYCDIINMRMGAPSQSQSGSSQVQGSYQSNPFSVNNQQQEDNQTAKKGNLEINLETVFYTK